MCALLLKRHNLLCSYDLKQLNLPILHQNGLYFAYQVLWLILLLMERAKQFAILDFTKVVLIGGTGYTGEMKRNFSALNFILPVFKNTLPMQVPM
jgi:hypothetical protein